MNLDLPDFKEWKPQTNKQSKEQMNKQNVFSDCVKMNN